MAKGRDANFEIGADGTPYEAGMRGVIDSTNEAVALIKENFGQVGETFAAVGEGFAAFTALLAGGAAFREAIEATVNLSRQSYELGQQFGIGATQASVLRASLSNVFATQDQFTAAGIRITNTLNTNEQALRDLGVETRDANGNLRDTLSIMLDANELLMGFKEGVDRNVETAKVYGKGWGEVSQVLRLTQEVMEASRAKAEALGLVIGERSVEEMFAYRTAMNDTGDVIEAVFKAIGDEVLPSVTELGEWFASKGPATVEVFRSAIQALATVFDSLRESIGTLFEVVTDVFGEIGQIIASAFGADSISGMEIFKNVLREIEVAAIALRATFVVVVQSVAAAIEYLLGWLYTFANVASNAFKLDWAGVRAAWNEGMDRIGKDWQGHIDKINAEAAKAGEDINNALTRDLGSKRNDKPIEQPESGETSTGGTDKSLGQKLDAELAARRAAWVEEQNAHGTFIEFSKEMERSFWEEKLATTTAKGEELLAIQKKIDDLSYAIRKDGFDAELAQLHAQESAFKNNLDTRLELAEQYAELVRKAYGADSKQYADAAAAIISIERQKQAQLQQIAQQAADTDTARALAGIDAAEEEAKTNLSLGVETRAQLLAQEAQFEAARNEIRRSSLLEKLRIAEADPDRNPVLVAQIHAQIEQLEIQSQQRMTQIRNQQILEQQRDWGNLFGSLESGFNGVIQQMLAGSLSASGVVEGLFKAVGQTIQQTLAQILARMIRNFIEARIVAAATGKSIIGTHAAEAGAAAWKSAAAIPYVGWLLGPIEAAAAYAGVLAFGGRISSAEGGYDIPAGIDPVTQLHEREMVLPEEQADVIRSMSQGTGGRRLGVEFIPVGDDHGLVRMSELAAALDDLSWRFAR